MTMLRCMSTWPCYGAWVYDNVTVHDYMTMLWCMSTWPCYNAWLHDHVTVHDYMTMLRCMSTWQCYGAWLHGNVTKHCSYIWMIPDRVSLVWLTLSVDMIKKYWWQIKAWILCTGGMIMTWENWRSPRETCSSVTLITTNPTWTDQQIKTWTKAQP